MGCYVNLCSGQAVPLYFMFKEFVYNSYTSKRQGLQFNGLFFQPSNERTKLEAEKKEVEAKYLL